MIKIYFPILSLFIFLQGCTYQPDMNCDFTPYLTSQQQNEFALVPMTPETMTPVPLNSVRMIDTGIIRKILPQSVTAVRTGADTVQIATRLINCTDYPQQVEARTHFLDQTQQPTENPSAWKRLYLSPNSLASYNESSMDDTHVASFLIEVRSAQ